MANRLVELRRAEGDLITLGKKLANENLAPATRAKLMAEVPQFREKIAQLRALV